MMFGASISERQGNESLKSWRERSDRQSVHNKFIFSTLNCEITSHYL